MSDLKKPSDDLLIELINASNRNLPFPLTKDNVTWGSPVAITPIQMPPGHFEDPNDAGYVDTEILVSSKNTQYIGNLKLKYRRIKLSDYFRSINPEIHMYSPTPTTVPFSTVNLLPQFNSKYGINLESPYLVSENFPAGTIGYYQDYSSIAQFATTANSPVFSGSVGVRWVNAKQDLESMLQLSELQGRLYPGGNTFDSSHRYMTDLIGYCYDFSAINTTLSLTNPYSYPIGDSRATTSHQTIISALNQATGLNFVIGDAGSMGTPFVLYGCTMVWYMLDPNQPAQSLPANRPYPESTNASKFNRLCVIKVDNAWGIGDMLLHFTA